MLRFFVGELYLSTFCMSYWGQNRKSKSAPRCKIYNENTAISWMELFLLWECSVFVFYYKSRFLKWGLKSVCFQPTL